MTTRIIPPRVSLVDPRTGLIAREWYLYFLSLNGEVDTIGSDAIGFAPPPVPVDIAAAVQDAVSLTPPLVPAVVATGGATPNGTATVTVAGLPEGSIEWTQTVSAPGLTSGSLVFVQLAPPDDALENDPEMLDIAAMAAACTSNDTLTVTMAFATPTIGPIALYYGVM
jgi:hypothetical protein